MEIKSFKKFCTIMMVLVMVLSISTVAFAAEDTSVAPVNTISDTSVSTTIPANGTETLDLGYKSTGWVEVTFVTACSVNNGRVNWQLYREGIRVDSGSVGVNDMTYHVFNYSSGNYTITLTNTANADTTVFILNA